METPTLSTTTVHIDIQTKLRKAKRTEIFTILGTAIVSTRKMDPKVTPGMKITTRELIKPLRRNREHLKARRKFN